MTATFIGIDLAWKSARNPSGAAVLTGDRSGARLKELATLPPEASVAHFISRHVTDNTVVTIDGPLVIVNETGQRPCEIEVSKRYSSRDAGCYPSNLQLLPNASSVALAAELETQGFTHVDRARSEHKGRIMAEVYPHAGMVALWDLAKTIKYKRGSPALKRSGLQQFRARLASLYQAEPPLVATEKLQELLNHNLDGPGRSDLKSHEDRLDALFCAYLAYYFWYWGWERNELFGDVHTGYILNPILREATTHVAPSSPKRTVNRQPLEHEGDYTQLIKSAHQLARPIKTSEDCSAGSVASVIVSRSGKEYSGVCLDFSCSLGFCAEHAAIAEMLKAHESEIATVVAVDERGTVLPPCGRCREMMWQLNPSNRNALVVLGPHQAIPLNVLLPHR